MCILVCLAILKNQANDFFFQKAPFSKNEILNKIFEINIFENSSGVFILKKTLIASFWRSLKISIEKS